MVVYSKTPNSPYGVIGEAYFFRSAVFRKAIKSAMGRFWKVGKPPTSIQADFNIILTVYHKTSITSENNSII
jgi:hypothetical protein